MLIAEFQLISVCVCYQMNTSSDNKFHGLGAQKTHTKFVLLFLGKKTKRSSPLLVALGTYREEIHEDFAS